MGAGISPRCLGECCCGVLSDCRDQKPDWLDSRLAPELSEFTEEWQVWGHSAEMLLPAEPARGPSMLLAQNPRQLTTAS